MATCEETLNAIKLAVDELSSKTVDVSLTQVQYYTGTAILEIDLKTAFGLISYQLDNTKKDLSEIKSFLGLES